MSDSVNCIFCKIVAGDIPAQVVLETPEALAFLDIAPLSDGHTLLVPKQHYTTLHNMPASDLKALTGQLSRLAAAVVRATGVSAYNILQNNGRPAGQVVEHVHFHIIPRTPGDDLGYRWNAKQYKEGKAEELRRRIQSSLSG
ncbi:MAG: HIT family protein [Planctomycetes bacterium]|nr:HIT family protein [Planctomycetota bacterium]